MNGIILDYLKLDMILIIGLLFIICLALFAISFPVYYVSELILSFLPYMVFFSLVGFGLTIALLRNKRIAKYIKIMPLFILLFGLLFFLSSRQYNYFYTGEGFEDQNTTGNTEGMDILYSNILYTNDDFVGLQNMIQERNPDMIFMVEFMDEHNDNLQNILKVDYPYSARTNGSKRYFGGVVFSKYPITNLTHEVDQGSWRYSYFYTKYGGESYYIYLVHTSSPVSYYNFDMRNNQFDILSNDFVEHQKNRTKNDKVLMLGDFNVSPWSVYYKDLADNLLGLTNITKNFTILFTWGVSYLPFLQTHIDHIFVSDNIVVGNVDKVNTPGSDHDGYFMENVR